jgi:hypothetical protein
MPGRRADIGADPDSRTRVGRRLHARFPARAATVVLRP